MLTPEDKYQGYLQREFFLQKGRQKAPKLPNNVDIARASMSSQGINCMSFDEWKRSGLNQ